MAMSATGNRAGTDSGAGDAIVEVVGFASWTPMRSEKSSNSKTTTRKPHPTRSTTHALQNTVQSSARHTRSQQYPVRPFPTSTSSAVMRA